MLSAQVSSFDTCNTSTSFSFRQNHNRFLVNPVVLLPSKQRRVHLRRVAKVPIVAGIGRNVVLELFDTKEDPKTKAPKKSRGAVLKDWSKKAKVKAEWVH
ncbi:hypothetical protein V6N13_018567 [Hibiscus sabdariffa]